MGLPEIIIDNNFHYNVKNFSVKTRAHFPILLWHIFAQKRSCGPNETESAKNEYGKRKKTARVCVKMKANNRGPALFDAGL